MVPRHAHHQRGQTETDTLGGPADEQPHEGQRQGGERAAHHHDHQGGENGASAPIRPRTGVTMAPLKRVMVCVHCALSSDTPNVVATLVMSGAPRLPTAATT